MLPRKRLFPTALRAQAERGSRHGRFSAVGDLEPLQNGGDMDLHRRLGEVKSAADGLVALALHHEREHLHLALRQAEIDG